MSTYTFRDLAEKTAAMREFRRLRDAGLPVPAEVRERHVQATNDGYATGPEPGERVPNFALPDQHGSIRGIEDLAGPGGLFLVFHRSADW
ncbi:MAG TPA: hypothetical protein VFW44_13530 [Bryobacteraceae bacterium]|nr:hypothetical protein [Bryobacteraceae bacterium]